MHGHATTPEAMSQLGQAAATLATPGTCFALVGDLGAGKTHWTKGFVTGIGSTASVTSPTFGLVHEYHGGRLPVFHFDFYRMESAEELLAIGWDDYLDQDGITIVEWAGKFPQLLPPGTHWLHITLAEDGSRLVSPADC
jgi:tRNA threonylcarbamoyladenosine biosynthesis protein TsaE